MDFYQKFISDKAKKKRELLGKMFFPRTPVLLMDLCAEEEKELLAEVMDGAACLPVSLIVVIHEKNPHKRSGNVIFVDPGQKHNALQAADISITMNGDRELALKSGCVPISQLDGKKTVEYNPLAEEGNGFYFKNPTKWEMFASVVRALETYKFPFDWENLIREILRNR